ncbi:MAG: hypothetical protein LAO07_16055 [Acidobacteriia bacterium]|nr:hypothetical protein [Terriglobia bacterium]
MKWVAPIISSVLFACGSGSPTPESSSLRFPLKDPANGKTSPSLGRSATAQNVDDLLATLGRDGSSLTASPGPSASLTGYGQPLPQGLTCGLSYTDGYGIVAKNTCNGIPTMELVPSSGIGVCYSGFSRCEGCNCIGSPDTQCFPTPFFPYPIDTRDPYIYACQAYEPDGLLVQAGPGFVRIWDNDSGVGYTPGEYYLPGPFGFWHQELVDGTTDVTLSDTFVLPKGTACGLHYPFLPAGFTQFHNRTCMGYNPAKAFGWELDDLNSCQYRTG